MSFIHAAFLAAGLAVAIPWLLHLTRKRKYLRIRLGSLQFLDPVVRDRHRMSRIEQWPLLLARCLAVLLLALVFARPFFPKPAPVPPVAGEIILLLDASGSITPKQADALRKQAVKTLDSLPETSRPLIVAVSEQVEILASLDAYQPVAGSASGYSRAVDWVVDRAASTPDAIAGVHWFTDLQKSPLPAAPSRLWPSGLSVKIHPALPPTDSNVALEQIELLTPFGGDRWEIEARVRVYGMPGTIPLDLVLTTADGKQIAGGAPPEGGPVRFAWEGVATNDLLTGSVAVVRAGDSWPADDQRAFAFPTKQPKRIHLVDGDPGGSPFLSEAYFLEKALHASAAGKALSPFRATVSESLPAATEPVEVIALCNVTGLTSSNAGEIQRHVERGGGLAIFLGDQSVPSSWTAAAKLGLIPEGLRALAEPAPAFVRKSDLTHPGLAGLSRDTARGLGLLPLMRRFTWPAHPLWSTVMEFDDGAPLLAFSHSSKIAVVTHPANREGSDLPLNPAFVPWVQEIFNFLSRPATTSTRTLVTTLVPGRDERRSPGLYPNDQGVELVAADVTESDISNADEKTFRRQLGLPALDAPPPVLLAPAAAPESSHLREGELWPWLLAALLVLLILESGLAARRARPSATPDAHVD